MLVRAEYVRAGLGHAKRLADEILDQLAAAPVVVLALRVLDHGLVVHIGKLDADHRVLRVGADVDLGDPPVPLLDLRQHDPRLAAGQRRPDRAVVERGEPGRGQLLQRRDAGRDGRQQQRLRQPVVRAERRGELARVRRVRLGEPVVGEDQRAQLVLVERVRGLEQRGRLRVERLGARNDVVEGVTDRDDVVDGERVPPVDEHLLHHLQRGALPLHDAGQVPQCGHQRRRERVGEAERLLVRAPVLVVGVDPVEQHVPDGGAAVDPRERVPQHQLGLGVVGPLAQQAPVRHVGQVVVAEHDGAEPALLVPERAVQRLLLGAAGPGVGEPAAQVHLPGDERDERDRPRPHARLDQLGELLRLAAEELAVLHTERQPQHELVKEQHDGVVAEALGVLGDDGQAGVEVDELRLAACRTRSTPW